MLMPLSKKKKKNSPASATEVTEGLMSKQGTIRN